MHRSTRELALAGMMAALGTVFLLLAGILPLAFYACPLLASSVLLIVRSECRERYAWSCFFAVAVLGLLLGPDREADLLYCFLGYYPLVKPRLDVLAPRGLRVAAKLTLYAAAVGAMYGLILFVFRMEAIAREFAETQPWFVIALVLMGAVTFLLYDRVLVNLERLYLRRKK